MNFKLLAEFTELDRQGLLVPWLLLPHWVFIIKKCLVWSFIIGPCRFYEFRKIFYWLLIPFIDSMFNIILSTLWKCYISLTWNYVYVLSRNTSFSSMMLHPQTEVPCIRTRLVFCECCKVRRGWWGIVIKKKIIESVGFKISLVINYLFSLCFVGSLCILKSKLR